MLLGASLPGTSPLSPKSGSNLKSNIVLFSWRTVFTPADSDLSDYSPPPTPQVTTALSSVTSFPVTLKIILNRQESPKPTGKQSREAPSEVAVGSWRPMPTETRSTSMAVRYGKPPPSRWTSLEQGEQTLSLPQGAELITSPDPIMDFM